MSAPVVLDAVQEQVVLGVHGGIGWPRASLLPGEEPLLRHGIEQALRAGLKVLQAAGGTSLSAVEAAVRVLEDDPLFNAGRGAVFTHDGRNELDASIMEGTLRRAGAVAGLTTIRSPISAARAVMERSKHVLLIGAGAEQFAREQGLETVDPSYFATPRRYADLQASIAEELNEATTVPTESVKKTQPHGTVGAVARDAGGRLAAATSTGGMTNKRFGRVGDTPIPGAGTYADDAVGAVSCTGHGEYFLRYVVAHEVISMARYRGCSLHDALHEVIHQQLAPAGGEGGAIALSREGQFSAATNAEGMYRGCINQHGDVQVRLYVD